MRTSLKLALLSCISAFSLSSLLAEGLIELGSVDVGVADGWTLIDFENNYTTPIITIGSITRNDADSVVPQVRNVTATSFEVRLVDWGTAGLHTETETISFIAMEQGRHEIGGVIFEAGKKNDFGALPFSQNNQTGFSIVRFDPIVKQESAEGDWNYSAFTQIVGDANPSAIHCRHQILASWSDQFQFRFEQALDDASEVTISELHYIIVQAGEGVTSNGVPFKSFSTARLYEEVPKDLEFGASYPDPLVYARMPFIFGPDSTALRITNLSDTKLTAYADEATGWNKLHTKESIALLVIGAPPELGNSGDFNHLIAGTITAEDIGTDTLNAGVVNTGSLSVTELSVQNVGITGNLVLSDASGAPFTVNVNDLRALSSRTLGTLAIGENAVITGDTKLAVNGAVNIAGSVIIDGNTVLTGDVTLDQAQGDISMGEFGNNN